MAINSIGSTPDIGQLITGIMDRVDANKDGQLSKDEFGTFLTSLLGGINDKVKAGTAANTSPILMSMSTPTATAATARSSYDPIPGFDSRKLNDPSHLTTKYTFARAVQDLGLAPASGNLQAVVDYLNARGGAAKVTGDDTIDFGDGFGPIDVIFSVGDPEARWQWLPTA
jgi:hypothetical protein